jgi:hypothetical protein
MIEKTAALAAISAEESEWRAKKGTFSAAGYKATCAIVLAALRAVKRSVKALPAAALLLMLLAGCASGRGGTQVVQACSGLPALQAYCQTSVVKSRQLARTCEQVPLAQLLCAVTAAPRAESAAASVTPSCPEPPSPACVGALLESQGWRALTSSRREKLQACADYLVGVQSCLRR